MKHKQLTQLLLLIMLLNAALDAGCNTPPGKKYFKNGKQYGVVNGLFRERWWNFYQRGESFLEGGFPEEAIADFREALRQRDRDQRRARTYGMHFIDYFPHRELGAAYYHAGKYPDALRELEISLAAVDSGRAKYYLNEVHRAILKTLQADTAPPVISLNSGVAQEITNQFKITIAGAVEDGAYVDSIAINDEPVFIELAQKRLPFFKEIEIKRGVNTITIKSRNLLGKAAEKTVTMIGDFEGPLLQVNNATDGEGITRASLELHGTLTDASGITELKINDRVIPYHRERKAAFSHTVHLASGTNRIVLCATDVAGNTTFGELQLIYTEGNAQLAPESRRSGTGQNSETAPVRLALQGAGVLDTGAHRLFASAMPGRQPGADFRITLKELQDGQAVFSDTLYIDGSVTGAEEITSIIINGSPLSVQPGRTIFFNQLIELKSGENKLTINVQDKKGATASKAVVVTYQSPSVKQIGSRMSLAILPFEQKGIVTAAGSAVYDSMVSAFLHQGRFNLISRGAELEAALRELKLSSSGLADKGRALQLGRIVAAEGILMGTINETPKAIEIYARLINTETAELMDAQDVYAEDKTLSRIQYSVNGLALKFRHSFPLLEGIVIKASGKDIYADFGMASRIRKDMKFIIFRDEEVLVHPLNGKKLGSPIRELGLARVVNVLEDMTIGRLISGGMEEKRIKVKDRIITR